MSSFKELFISMNDNIIKSVNYTYFVLAAVIIFILLMYLYGRQRHKVKQLKKLLSLNDELSECLVPSKGLDNNLNEILRLISPIVAVSVYSFYLFDAKNKQYVLKAVRHSSINDGAVKPYYSGLLSFKKETYLPPLSLADENISDKTTLIKSGNVPLLDIPIKGTGLIRIGTIQSVSSEQKAILNNFSAKLKPVIDILVETDRLKNQVEELVSSSNAIRGISSIMSDNDEMLSIILGISIKTVGASGGLFLKKEHQEYKLSVIAGMDKRIEDFFRTDSETHNLFNLLTSKSNCISLKKGDKNFSQIPPYFVSAGIEMFFLLNVHSQDSSGIIVLWYNEKQTENTIDIDNHRITALQMMAKRMGDILSSQVKYNEMSDSYVEMLKTLAQMVDSMSRYSMGYSEMMYRYAKNIALKMNLEKQEIEGIALAAYLSNIGIIGLSANLYFKEGRFSELEYEMMKLHSDVGASIIDAVLSNRKLSSYIRHHHERIDGLGYPANLKGDQIPVGARIIAVVQAFLAKINARKDREPLEFNQALNMLSSASGTQLDKVVVDSLISWFKDKRCDPSFKGYSLGPCWEMRCVPKTICSSCSAYMQNDKNCWEFESNNCSNHGNICKSCYVYTEFESRQNSSEVRLRGQIR